MGEDEDEDGEEGIGDLRLLCILRDVILRDALCSITWLSCPCACSPAPQRHHHCFLCASRGVPDAALSRLRAAQPSDPETLNSAGSRTRVTVVPPARATSVTKLDPLSLTLSGNCRRCDDPRKRVKSWCLHCLKLAGAPRLVPIMVRRRTTEPSTRVIESFLRG